MWCLGIEMQTPTREVDWGRFAHKIRLCQCVILPCGCLKVTLNKLIVFKDNRERDGCRVSRAQAVKVLSPRCLPWILPNNETSALDVQVEQRDSKSASGIIATSLRNTLWWVGAVGVKSSSYGGFIVLVVTWGWKWVSGMNRVTCSWFWRSSLSYLREWSATMGV